MAGQKLKILIVDDDPKFLEMFRRNLESKNCLVQTASDQKTALSLLVNEAFHVIFIDCILNTGRGGIELAQDIKRILGNSIEIIMISGIVTGKSLSNYIDLGICDFLSKPISEREIEDHINHIMEKYIHGNKKNLLDKLFSKTPDIQILKLLISLQKAKDYEFFLYLNSALSSKESLTFQFKFNNKTHKITCDKKEIVNYESDSSEIFLKRLLSKNYITEQEALQLKSRSESESVQSLLQNCILSTAQIMDVKYDILVETLKEISPGIEISININLTSPEKKSFMLLNQDEYVDLVFLFLKQRFNNQLFSMFDDDIMNRSLICEENLPNYIPEIDSFISDLKDGMKLTGIYNKYINDKNSFCSYIIYILLKGGIYLSRTNMHVQYHYLYERYENLYQFFNKAEKPEKVFVSLKAPSAEAISENDIKEAYLSFVKKNHQDTIHFDIPEDLSNLITKVLSKIKDLYDFCNDHSIRIKRDKQHKKEKMEKEIILTEKKKICERHLEEKKYKEAFSLIEAMPEKTIDTEPYWQLLYLWLHMRTKHITDKATSQKYLKNVKAKARELQKEKLYYYILGLHYKNKAGYEQAKRFFQKAKSLDPSFQPCYQEIKECSIQLLGKNKKNLSFMDKLNSISISSLKKKLKKAG